MNRSFLQRAAIAAVLLLLGVASVWGEHSFYDRCIASLNQILVAIVLATLSAFWCALALWVCHALRLPPGGHWRDLPRCKSAAVLAVVSAACLAGQPARAVVLELPRLVKAIHPAPAQTVEIQQPFTLSPDVQRQVDAAVADASKDAQESPGVLVSLELALGILIAAIVIGTVLVIVVRMICKSLDKMKADLQNRLTKVRHWLEHPGQTNAPAVIGAGLFLNRPATAADLPTGLEFNLEFTAPERGQPASIAGTMANGEQVSWSEFLSDFGLKDNFPSDSIVGQGVSRSDGGYKVALDGFHDLVTLEFESKMGLTNAFNRVLSLRVPAGAILDVSDLSGASERRFWRVGVSP